MHRADVQFRPGDDHYTVPCWHWPLNCRYGEKCTFRHGAADARAVARQRAALDRQPEGRHEIGTYASMALLQWLNDRLHAAQVSMHDDSNSHALNGLA
jgi:hypothetical protein